ncbi:hypothetical protein TNCT_709431, partial [Trichonephila clavata]
VFVSYINQLQLTHSRQSALKELYYFRCQCIRCTTSLYDDKMDSFIQNGKIQLYYGSPTDAKDALKQAENIMKVTHGEQHFLYQDLVKLLAEIQK